MVAAPGPEQQIPEVPRILLVDDQPRVLRALARVLSEAGYDVATASDGQAALEHMHSTSFEAVVTDISMPNLTGIDFLRAVREFDVDVPVILMTGAPALESAAVAVEYGAFRYLSKPIEAKTLETVVRRAVLMHGLAKLKRHALDAFGVEGVRMSDHAALDARFSKAISTLWVAFQPIVSRSRACVHAYEALVRTDEETLSMPTALLDAAERLGRMRDIGRAVRQCVGEAMHRMPLPVLGFVNVSAEDLLDDDLYDASSILARSARRVVLEVTERASLDSVSDLVERIAKLRQLGFRVAVDDLGAGYAGLSSLARLEPDVLKLDISLVRDVDTNPVKRRLVQSMVGLARALCVDAVAEGIETAAELDVLVDLGLDLFQGFYFARPDRALCVPELASLR